MSKIIVGLLSICFLSGSCIPLGGKGPKGSTGDQGDPGKNGETGKAGDPGKKGDKGAEGAQGEKGEDGLDTKLSMTQSESLEACNGPGLQIKSWTEKNNSRIEGSEQVEYICHGKQPVAPKVEKLSGDDTYKCDSRSGYKISFPEQDTDTIFICDGETGQKGERGERGERGLQGQRGEDGQDQFTAEIVSMSLSGENGKPITGDAKTVVCSAEIKSTLTGTFPPMKYELVNLTKNHAIGEEIPSSNWNSSAFSIELGEIDVGDEIGCRLKIGLSDAPAAEDVVKIKVQEPVPRLLSARDLVIGDSPNQNDSGNLRFSIVVDERVRGLETQCYYSFKDQYTLKVFSGEFTIEKEPVTLTVAKPVAKGTTLPLFTKMNLSCKEGEAAQHYVEEQEGFLIAKDLNSESDLVYLYRDLVNMNENDDCDFYYLYNVKDANIIEHAARAFEANASDKCKKVNYLMLTPTHPLVPRINFLDYLGGLISVDIYCHSAWSTVKKYGWEQASSFVMRQWEVIPDPCLIDIFFDLYDNSAAPETMVTKAKMKTSFYWKHRFLFNEDVFTNEHLQEFRYALLVDEVIMKFLASGLISDREEDYIYISEFYTSAKDPALFDKFILDYPMLSRKYLETASYGRNFTEYLNKNVSAEYLAYFTELAQKGEKRGYKFFSDLVRYTDPNSIGWKKAVELKKGIYESLPNEFVGSLFKAHKNGNKKVIEMASVFHPLHKMVAITYWGYLKEDIIEAKTVAYNVIDGDNPHKTIAIAWLANNKIDLNRVSKWFEAMHVKNERIDARYFNDGSLSFLRSRAESLYLEDQDQHFLKSILPKIRSSGPE